MGWFENFDGLGSFSDIKPISRRVLNAQGVSVADVDGDGDLDVPHLLSIEYFNRILQLST